MIFYSKLKLVYEGQFSNDVYQGWGRTKHYRGQFYKGKRHGWGIYEDSDKNIRYEGSFEGGHFHGIGFVNLHEREVKEFMEKSAFINEGGPDFRYVGEWKEGVISGVGKIVSKSEVYSGQFTNGSFNG